MAKSKFLTTILLGAASGAAASIFLNSKKGRDLQADLTDKVNHYMENYSEINSDLIDKARKQFDDYKTKLDTYDFDYDNMKTTALDKATDIKDKSSDRFSEIRDKIAQQNFSREDLLDSVKEKATSLADRVQSQVTPESSSESDSIDITIDFDSED